MEKASNIVVKILAIALLIAAVLKGWQLLTEPVANNDIWSYRPFLILTVEFELALGIWLLSGLFKKAAWLATLLCFSVFSAITLYKGITGAESCGCFGSVHVNPWITLFAIDLPAVIVLAVFRPALSFLRKQKSIAAFVRNSLAPLPSKPRFATILSIGMMILAVTGCVLGFNEPAKSTASYEVLEPETWVGKKLPILEHIDIGENLKKGNWVVLLYHYDCPECSKAIETYEQISHDLKNNEDFLQIALIEVPPYCPNTGDENHSCTHGRLANTKKWLITTPTVVLLTNSRVVATWEEHPPILDTIVRKLASIINRNPRFEYYSKILAYTDIQKGGEHYDRIA